MENRQCRHCLSDQVEVVKITEREKTKKIEIFCNNCAKTMIIIEDK